MWAMCERAQQVLRELFPTHQAQLHIGTIGATYIARRGYECILVDSASLALREEAMLDALYVMAETALNPDGFLLLVG
jgi:Leu/Phe-tRNA-protein transferase